jgi:hypothetical protein
VAGDPRRPPRLQAPREDEHIRAILLHQILSERRFFAQFVGTEEPPVEALLPPGEAPAVADYIDRYLGLAKARLPQLAAATAGW